MSVEEMAALSFDNRFTRELPADPDYDGIWDYMWCTDTLCVINPLLQYTTSSCLLPSPPHSSMASLARWLVIPCATL